MRAAKPSVFVLQAGVLPEKEPVCCIHIQRDFSCSEPVGSQLNLFDVMPHGRVVMLKGREEGETKYSKPV